MSILLVNLKYTRGSYIQRSIKWCWLDFKWICLPFKWDVPVYVTTIIIITYVLLYANERQLLAHQSSTFIYLEWNRSESIDVEVYANEAFKRAQACAGPIIELLFYSIKYVNQLMHPHTATPTDLIPIMQNRCLK